MTTAKAKVQGREIEMLAKSSVSNKNLITMNMMGMTVMKQVVGDKTGYQEAQGQKKAFEGEEFATMKQQSFPFVELKMLTDKTIVLSGIESLNGQDAYAIQVGTSKYFYDVKTGLRVATENESGVGAEKRKGMTYYADYVDVKGIKFPYKMTIDVGMPLEFITQDVKINEGVTEKDFE